MHPKIARIERVLDAWEPRERSCDLCPRDCRVDRTRGPAGVCRMGSQAGVARALLHYGEEPVISGTARPPGPASGTIFFSGCNLRCLFCQNHQISWGLEGRILTDEELAAAMLGLQEKGAYNINLVSPTHLLLPVLRALRLAYGRGLKIPLVYNSNGYEKAAVIERLAGIVDVYLPDLKYRSSDLSARYSGAGDYFEHASAAVGEMYIQQPDLILDEFGLARQGTIVRHLILPGAAADSKAVLEWIAGSLTPALPLSLMSQYHPCHKAPEELRRPLLAAEYREVLRSAQHLGFETLFLQPDAFGTDDHLVPDFRKDEPFRWK
jgi:putative pyruvate formate lyase activating enzyme